MLGLALNCYKSMFKNRRMTVLIVIISIAVAIGGLIYGLSLYDFFYEVDMRGLHYRMDIKGDNRTISDYDRELSALFNEKHLNDVVLYVNSNSGSMVYSYKSNYVIVLGNDFDDTQSRQVILSLDVYNMNKSNPEEAESIDIGKEIEINNNVYTIVGFSTSNSYFINRYAAEELEFECVRFSFNIKDSSRNIKKYNELVKKLLSGQNTRVYYERPEPLISKIFEPLSNIGFLCSIIIVVLSILNITFQYGHIVDYNKSIHRAMILCGNSKLYIVLFNLILSMFICLSSIVIGEIINLVLLLIVKIDVRISFIQHIFSLIFIMIISSITTITILAKQLKMIAGGRN